MTKSSKHVKKSDVLQEVLSKGREISRDFDESGELAIAPIQNKLISIRLPVSMLRQLRAIAVAKGDIGYQQIIKAYVAEGIRGDYESFLHAPSVSYDVTSSATAVELEVV